MTRTYWNTGKQTGRSARMTSNFTRMHLIRTNPVDFTHCD